jgi:hypothetical protein
MGDTGGIRKVYKVKKPLKKPVVVSAETAVVKEATSATSDTTAVTRKIKIKKPLHTCADCNKQKKGVLFYRARQEYYCDDCVSDVECCHCGGNLLYCEYDTDDDGGTCNVCFIYQNREDYCLKCFKPKEDENTSGENTSGFCDSCAADEETNAVDEV